jgi:glyceraldehyde 3-phosphate dehydrogenase
MKYLEKNVFEIISDSQIKINHHTITLLSNRDAKNLSWSSYGCEYIIDATGSYLTSKKCAEHGAKYVVMSAPAKDITKTFIYGANHSEYNGETVVSASSCTTNCIAPMLKILNDAYKIIRCNFTTIHATTASQYAVDILGNTRISRSIFNNIIPHTTGASSSIVNVLPELDGKIHGTSLRVPVSNGSLIDLNVELEDTTATLSDISDLIKGHELFNIVYQINNKNLVSSDFVTTTEPTILDLKASIDMGEGRFKLMIWYDNEWSYSAQLVRIVEHMFAHNLLRQVNEATKKEYKIEIKEENLSIKDLSIKDLSVKDDNSSVGHVSQIKSKSVSSFNKYYFKNIAMTDQKVVARFDFNVPTINGIITDDFRISSAVETIKQILECQNPKYLLLTSHFGRPTEKDKSGSLQLIVPVLENYLGQKVLFLPDGISEQTASILAKCESKVYLLENLRFHKEETLYEYMPSKEIERSPIVKLYRSFGDVFISDAFGCAHRKHMSICDAPSSGKKYGYGDLIHRELSALNMLIANESEKRILGIIGGNKIKDKMPLIDSIRKIRFSKIFVAGGIATKYKALYGASSASSGNVVIMSDGYGDDSVNVDSLSDDRLSDAKYIEDIHDISSLKNAHVFDIGDKSIEKLLELVEEADIIFWNGSLGKIEDDRYIKGSEKLVNYLVNATDKKVIIGGGETASLFANKDARDHIYISTGGGALLEYLQNKILYNKDLVGIEMFFPKN